MARHETTPSLLAFTLGPARERARRRLLPERLGAVERSLHEQCLRSALAAGRSCGFRLLVSSPTRPAPDLGAIHLAQAGSSFGERLVGAAEAVDGPLLIVATDVPDLTAAPLREAAGAMAEDPQRVVVGPSPDGGFYLLGFTGTLRGILEKVRWQSPTALASLLSALRAVGRPVRLLKPLADLDHRSALERWVAGRPGLSPAWQRTIARLRLLLRELGRPLNLEGRLIPAHRGRSAWAGRAPPRFFAS